MTIRNTNAPTRRLSVSFPTGLTGCALVVTIAGALGAGCRGECSDAAKNSHPCLSDHEFLACSGDPGDEFGQGETTSICPPQRPVCQSTPNGGGDCVSLHPLLCMEQLVATTTARWIDVADIDGDGLDDILFSESTGVLAARGAADGSFGVPMAVADGPQVQGIARFDGDGIPDLWRSETSGGLSFAPGTGHGTFGAWQAVPAVSGSVVVVADLDGDGRGDVVDQIVHPDLSFEIVLRRNATAFAPTATKRFLPGDEFPRIVALPLRIGAVASASNDPRWVIGLTYGSYTELYSASDFGGKSLASTMGSPTLIADYNRDGFMDAVFGDAVALGDGKGHFGPAGTVGPDTLYAADFDGDGIIDFKRVGFFGSTPGAFTPTVTLRGIGDGTFVEGKTAYDQRGVISAAPIRRIDGAGANLAIIATIDYQTNEIRILRGSCP